MNTLIYNRGNRKSEFTVSDVFMGYHADMCAAVILHVIQERDLDAEDEVDQEQFVCICLL